MNICENFDLVHEMSKKKKKKKKKKKNLGHWADYHVVDYVALSDIFRFFFSKMLATKQPLRKLYKCDYCSFLRTVIHFTAVFSGGVKFWHFHSCVLLCTAPAAPRKTRAELMKDIDADYYGYRDEDDGLIVPAEMEAEKEGKHFFFRTAVATGGIYCSKQSFTQRNSQFLHIFITTKV
jgi:hypothetical protein